MIMAFRCSSLLHACPATTNETSPFDIKFFSLKDPLHPRFISHYIPTSKNGIQVEPHEMFLWTDPTNKNRALLFISLPKIFADDIPNLLVRDISHVPDAGEVTAVTEGNWNHRFPGTNQPNHPFDSNSPDGCGPYDCNLFVHSMGVKPDGTLTYLALEAGHFLVLDTSQVAAGMPKPQLVLLTDPKNRPVWLQDPLGLAAVPGEFPGGCATEAMVGDIDWQSGGLQIIDTGDSTHLVRAGFFVPDPPASVANEDPALSEVLCSGAIPLLRTD